VDVAILLTPSDDVKAYWRALNYRGSIVVVDSPECGSLMHAHKVERERERERPGPSPHTRAIGGICCSSFVTFL
jgi:hypothetical protein